jgi:hypothetical protein
MDRSQPIPSTQNENATFAIDGFRFMYARMNEGMGVLS